MIDIILLVRVARRRFGAKRDATLGRGDASPGRHCVTTRDDLLDADDARVDATMRHRAREEARVASRASTTVSAGTADVGVPERVRIGVVPDEDG